MSETVTIKLSYEIAEIIYVPQGVDLSNFSSIEKNVKRKNLGGYNFFSLSFSHTYIYFSFFLFYTHTFLFIFPSLDIFSLFPKLSTPLFLACIQSEILNKPC
jgi:hypothetical protein